MRLLVAAVAAVLPIPHGTLLAIDGHMTGRNYLPTRMLPGFAYRSWSLRSGVLRVEFADRAGVRLEWRVEPMTGSCDTGRQKSFQLAGNKVWWAQERAEQDAWRCVFDQHGKALRLVAASTTPPDRLGASGLGVVVASARRS